MRKVWYTLIFAVSCAVQPPASERIPTENEVVENQAFADPLRRLRGRPILVHDANQVELKRSDKVALRGDLAGHKGHRLQYIVRTGIAQRAVVHKHLRDITDHVGYVPHDAFSVSLSSKDVDTLLSMEGIEVFDVPLRLKMRRELYRAGLDERRRDVSAVCLPTQLKLLLTAPVNALPSIHEEMERLCLGSIPSNASICRIVPGPPSATKLLVNTNACHLSEAAHLLASHPAVTWVEVRDKPKLRNKYATRIAQSSDGTSWTLWAHGLKGDGEVI
jgi:hypothetical protein